MNVKIKLHLSRIFSETNFMRKLFIDESGRICSLMLSHTIFDAVCFMVQCGRLYRRLVLHQIITITLNPTE